MNTRVRCGVARNRLDGIIIAFRGGRQRRSAEKVEVISNCVSLKSNFPQEIEMKRLTLITSIFALALVIFALPSGAAAQWRDRDDDDDRYGRNDDRYRNDRYGNSRYGRNIRGTVESLHQRARNFEQHLDRGNDRYGRSNRYDDLEELADRFVRATGDLREEYGQGRNLN